jgi:hypothetical protein
MELDLIFVLSIAGTFLAFGVLTGLYIWPSLRRLPHREALKILALPHTFRFLGLSFLFPGVVSPSLSSTFSIPAAWGDFGAAVLALLAIAALTRRWSFAMPLVWVFNLWGSIDLLYAYYQGIALRIDPGTFGAAFYIPTMIVPALLVTHALIFLLLVRPNVTDNTRLAKFRDR